MADARFEEGVESAVSLKAEVPEDLAVISALVQDGVLSGADLKWDRKGRNFAMMFNRFRWEDHVAAEREGRPYERARSLLVISDVMQVVRQGVAPGEGDVVLSLLALDWQAGSDGAGRVLVTLAGDGAIGVDVECLNVTLRDVSRPYVAPSRHMPTHGA